LPDDGDPLEHADALIAGGRADEAARFLRARIEAGGGGLLARLVLVRALGASGDGGGAPTTRSAHAFVGAPEAYDLATHARQHAVCRQNLEPRVFHRAEHAEQDCCSTRWTDVLHRFSQPQ
jgi:hypothetical protein